MASKARPFRLKPPEPLEGQVQRQIGDFLDWCPDVHYWWRANVGFGRLERPDGTLTAQPIRFNFVGCPDILGWLRGGTMLLVEVKKPSVKKGRKEQEAIIAHARGSGCVALIARDFSDVKRAIDEHYGRVSR